MKRVRHGLKHKCFIHLTDRDKGKISENPINSLRINVSAFHFLMTLFCLRVHKNCTGNPWENPTRINIHNIVAVNKMLIQADGGKKCCSF